MPSMYIPANFKYLLSIHNISYAYSVCEAVKVATVKSVTVKITAPKAPKVTAITIKTVQL